MSMVIVGAGLAGASAVEELREQGYDGEIVLLGAEPHLPYDRPPLSKAVLLGEREADSTGLHDGSWYADHRVDVRTGETVTGIDPSRRVVTTGSGEVGYDRLLLATGSEPRRFAAVDDAGARVAYLRTREDSAALRQALVAGTRVVVVGAGWIGLEVTAAARNAGAEVVVVEPQAQPLLAVMGERVGAAFADLHRRHGVDLRLATSVEGAGTGSVRLSDGATVPADLVVVAIGAAPRVGLAQAAGLDVDDGVLVDGALRTSDPHVLAAGDIAAHDHPLLGRRIRVEHWDNAIQQGKAAARSMLGGDEPYAGLPYFFTDQYDLGMEYVGHLPRGASVQVAVRGDLAGLDASVLWHDGGTVLAGMHVNQWDRTDQLRALVGHTLDADRLSDPELDLAELAAAVS